MLTQEQNDKCLQWLFEEACQWLEKHGCEIESKTYNKIETHDSDDYWVIKFKIVNIDIEYDIVATCEDGLQTIAFFREGKEVLYFALHEYRIADIYRWLGITEGKPSLAGHAAYMRIVSKNKYIDVVGEHTERK